MTFLSNAFNDPSNPWYYIIGVLFLVLIFAAVGVYVFLSSKKNKAKGDGAQPEQPEQTEQSEQHEQVEADTAADVPSTDPEDDKTE